jgi:hypothetical protein
MTESWKISATLDQLYSVAYNETMCVYKLELLELQHNPILIVFIFMPLSSNSHPHWEQICSHWSPPTPAWHRLLTGLTMQASSSEAALLCCFAFHDFHPSRLWYLVWLLLWPMTNINYIPVSGTQCYTQRDLHWYIGVVLWYAGGPKLVHGMNNESQNYGAVVWRHCAYFCTYFGLINQSSCFSSMANRIGTVYTRQMLHQQLWFQFRHIDATSCNMFLRSNTVTLSCSVISEGSLGHLSRHTDI